VLQSTQELIWVDAYGKLLCFYNPATKVCICLQLLARWYSKLRSFGCHLMIIAFYFNSNNLILGIRLSSPPFPCASLLCSALRG
jgi:hypothetical protein